MKNSTGAAPQPQPPTNRDIDRALDGAVRLQVRADVSPSALLSDAEVLTNLARQLGVVGRSAVDDEDGRHCANASARLLQMAIRYREIAASIRSASHA